MQNCGDGSTTPRLDTRNITFIRNSDTHRFSRIFPCRSRFKHLETDGIDVRSEIQGSGTTEGLGVLLKNEFHYTALSMLSYEFLSGHWQAWCLTSVPGMLINELYY